MPATRSPRLARLLQASDGAQVGAALPRRSLVFDAVLAVASLGLGLVLLAVLAQTADADDRLFVVLVSLPLAIRRRAPRLAMLLVVGVALVQLGLGVPIGFHDAAVLVVLYSAVGSTNRRFGLTCLSLGLIVVAAGALTGWWGYIDRQLATPSVGVRLLSTLGATILVVACWALGERLRSARLGSIALAQRAFQLEREREQQALIVAAAERTRIAREMHDVVAHGLSVMIVQADGAAYVVDTSPEMAKQALEQIAATGRDSLAEMRNLLGLLRVGDTAVASAPQPDLDDLEALLDVARQAGSTVTLEAEPLGPVPTMISLTAYRIVQEGLTNARKHGGSPVAVGLGREGDGLTVTVRDAGSEAAGAALTQDPGYGLTGVRERVAAVGGRVSAQTDPDGGFTLHAWLPLQESLDRREAT
ncbi:MAG TPA: histidine kinase [Propionibacteriaceae bacterium]